MTTLAPPAQARDKDGPADEWIEDLRRRFPTEPEVDRILTRKLQLCTTGPYTWPGLPDLE